VRALIRGYGGEASLGSAFFDLLAVEPEWMSRATGSESAWQSANVELFSVAMEDLQEFEEPCEEFAARVERGFLRAAEWVDSRPPGAFERWRDQGHKADIFVGGWLSNEQFDLMMPAIFLRSCGQAGLPIHICTND
jgi:hypothetical protein